MTHRRAKNALVQVLAADPLSFPEGLREIPETLRNLIDVEDPDFEFIVAAIRTFRFSGLDVEDEAVLALPCRRDTNAEPGSMSRCALASSTSDASRRSGTGKLGRTPAKSRRRSITPESAIA